MSSLVEDLLLLARLDAGRPLARDEVDLTRLALEAVGDARVVGPDHRWQLDLPDEPVVAPGDEQRLHQVLTNLLNNARRHTPPGTSVTVGVAEDPAAQEVVLSVAGRRAGPAAAAGRQGVRALHPRRLGPHPRVRRRRAGAVAGAGDLARARRPGVGRTPPPDAPGSRCGCPRRPARSLTGSGQTHHTVAPGPADTVGSMSLQTSTLTPPKSATSRAGRDTVRPRRGPARPPTRTRLGPPGAPRPAGRHRPAVPVGPRRVRLGELLLLRGRPGRVGLVEGVLLRLLRRRQLDHRRQAADGAVADGPVGADLRALARGASWCPQALMGVASVGAAARHRPSYDEVGGGRPDRRRGAGAHARSRC